MTFLVTFVSERVERIEADFFTYAPYQGTLTFWSKPHWYRFKRCVGIVPARVLSVTNENGNVDWLKQAGVKV